MKEKEHLYNFIINNHKLEILESRIEVFNPFKVLGVEKYEIRHSNVLAWLLNPNENHGLNDYFLKKVLSQAVLMNEDVLADEINLLEIHLANFSDTSVRREEQNIDILVESKNNKLLFIIENKIHSRESKHQLTKYLKYSKENYPNYDIIPILLTKTGDEPEHNEKFGILSHEIIHQLITETLNLKKEYLTDEISQFIQFYLNTLEKTLGMDESLKDLCQKIYNEHKEAIDLIVETINSDDTSLKDAFQEIHSKESMVVLAERDKQIWFLTNEIINSIPQKDNGWRIPYPIAFWIRKKDDTRLAFHIEVGPFENGESRLEFINHLESLGYSIRRNAKRLESKYTRLITNYIKIKDWSDKDELIDAVDKIYKKNKEEIMKIAKVVKEYNFE